jgi:hypothetical protein
MEAKVSNSKLESEDARSVQDEKLTRRRHHT